MEKQGSSDMLYSAIRFEDDYIFKDNRTITSAPDIALTEFVANAWDDDVLSVISEIDKRIVVVEAIQRVFNDDKTNELNTLHPLVLNARWLFGPEFDSPMFVSNSALTTVVKGLFNEGEYDTSKITNPRERPDIVCLKKSTLKAVCTDRIDNEASGIMKPDLVLIIELKRDRSKIVINEVSQAENYVRQVRKSGVLHKDATITAYVVGASIGDVDCNKNTDSGRIHVVTYGQLVETANTKLFGLRKQLKNHYEEIGDDSIVEMALREPKQTYFT